jgi:HlyD family secretion protein
MKSIQLKNIKRELDRQKQLINKGLISQQQFENLQRQFDQMLIEKQMASEKLELIEKGKVIIADTNIETVVKAPITGYILEKLVNVGDPVVPLTSYQAGTELMRIANMKNLLFKGTIDEIDVGKIKEGMSATLQIGALPNKIIEGCVTLISLKARKQDNTTVFPIEIAITKTQKTRLRAGFSANANIIIAQKDSVLAIPERVITFHNDSAFVNLPTLDENPIVKHIKVGLSDAIYIEVISGLENGQKVMEKKIKEIT